MFWRLLGFIGAVFSSMGWFVCFLFFFLFGPGGRPLWMGITGLLITVALSVGFVVIAEKVLARYGPTHWLYYTTVSGTILFNLGLLAFLLQNLLVPKAHLLTVRAVTGLGNLHYFLILMIGGGLLGVVYLVARRESERERDTIIPPPVIRLPDPDGPPE
jgi:phosphatidylglycerophosphate synthase